MSVRRAWAAAAAVAAGLLTAVDPASASPLFPVTSRFNAPDIVETQWQRGPDWRGPEWRGPRWEEPGWRGRGMRRGWERECFVRRERIRTPNGWIERPVRVCRMVPRGWT